MIVSPNVVDMTIMSFDIGAISKYVTLGNWLYVVAGFRLLSVYLGYTYPTLVGGQNLETQLFDRANGSSKKKDGSKAEFTGLTGRTFAVWTAVTCIVCVFTAQNVNNLAMLQLGLATFVIALGYFLLEFGVYKTVSFKTVSRPFMFATISALWILHTIKNLK